MHRARSAASSGIPGIAWTTAAAGEPGLPGGRGERRSLPARRGRPAGRAALHRALGIQRLLRVPVPARAPAAGRLRRRSRHLHLLRRHRGAGHDAALHPRASRARARIVRRGAVHPSSHPRAGGPAAHGRAHALSHREPKAGGGHRTDGAVPCGSARTGRHCRSGGAVDAPGRAAVPAAPRQVAQRVLSTCGSPARDPIARHLATGARHRRECGFKSTSHFSSSYRRAYARRPTDERQSQASPSRKKGSAPGKRAASRKHKIH